jgi:hypothetical protein
MPWSVANDKLPFVFYSSRVDKKITEIGEKVENQLRSQFRVADVNATSYACKFNSFVQIRKQKQKTFISSKKVIYSMFGNLVKTNLEQQSPMKISTKIVKFIYLKIEY